MYNLFDDINNLNPDFKKKYLQLRRFLNTVMWQTIQTQNAQRFFI